MPRNRPSHDRPMSLSADQIEELRTALEGELARLLRSIGLSAEAAKPVPLDQTAVGRLSRMDSLQNQAMARGLAEREQARLGQIQAALERVAAGTYGRCTECDDDIDFGRLIVLPESPRCPTCS